MKKLIYTLLSLFTIGTSAYSQFIVNYAKQLSGPSDVVGLAMTVDNSGVVYNCGTFVGSADMDPGTGVASVSAIGVDEMYIQKLDPNGDLLWAKTLGESSDGLTPLGIEQDNSGNIVIVGRFFGTTDFDPGVGTFNLITSGDADIFILKLNASGDFIWAKSIGGTGFDEARAIAIDAVGDIYITGMYCLTVDFDPGSGVANLVSQGQGDAFVFKLNSIGNLLWAKSMGGNDVNDEFNDYGNGIKVDGSGNVFVCGAYGSTADFDPGIGLAILNCDGFIDGYVQKLNSNGDHVWVQKISGTSSDEAKSITIDSFGNVVVTGYFVGGAYFDTELIPGFNNGGQDVFVAKFDGSNANLVWARKMGGSGQDIGFSVDTDNQGNIYSTGRFQSNAFFYTQSSYYTLTCVGITNTFVQRINSDGYVTWVIQLANGASGGTVISLDENNNLYTLGYFQGTVDFDPNSGTYNLTSGGNKDTYVYNMNINYNVSPYMSQISNLNAFSQTLGTPSTEQSFTVSGTNLTDNIAITAPVDYEISLTSGSGFGGSLLINHSSGIVPSTNIYVRLNSTSIGSHNGDLLLASGSLNEIISLTGNTTGNSVSIDETVSTLLHLYPNPTFGNLTITSSLSTSAKITSANGSVLMNLDLNGETTVDVSSFARGVYFVRTNQGETIRFVKE
ncbi:MAG: T9SS type A sorting domain-containing protein [Bacteroidetes bacterium]|nr:MAG: T9SS type A sorting domain-containing protein [Bacteroidota bacterium]